MSNFAKYIKNILNELSLTPENLFADEVVKADTFYRYNKRYPSLDTLIKIANYLKVSIDYIFELSDKNIFKPYKTKTNFFDNLNKYLTACNISQRKFCKDLKLSRTNLTRWKNGINPRVEILLDIVSFLKCSTNDLLDRE